MSRTTALGAVSEPANGNSTQPVISGNGGFVAFTSNATNLGAVTAPHNVFLRYLQANNTSLVSRMAGQGAAGSDSSGSPTISEDRTAGCVHVGCRQPFRSRQRRAHECIRPPRLLRDDDARQPCDGSRRCAARRQRLEPGDLRCRRLRRVRVDGLRPGRSADHASRYADRLRADTPARVPGHPAARRRFRPDLGLNDHSSHDGTARATGPTTGRRVTTRPVTTRPATQPARPVTHTAVRITSCS